MVGCPERTPAQVNKSDEVILWKLQYGHKTKKVRSKGGPATRFGFKLGDTVRLSHLQRPFQREYEYENIVASRGMKQGIPYYTIQDIQNDSVDGTFYQSELTKVNVSQETVFRIEKIISRRKNDVLVKWLHWPNKCNSYIPKSDLQHYQLAEK